MNSRLRNEKITAFVRDVLGCGCPDEVFRKIEISEIELVSAKVTRIVVGDTLLIYVLPETSDDILEHIGKLVATGKQDRDANGYNRFRLVMPGCADNALEQRVSSVFLESASDDEKLHLHFVKDELLKAVF